MELRYKPCVQIQPQTVTVMPGLRFFLPGCPSLHKGTGLKGLALPLLLCMGEILHLPPHTLCCQLFPSVYSVPSQDGIREKEPCAIFLCSSNITASS